MLDTSGSITASFDDARPLLVVLVDTEEEFDWYRPVSREATGTRNIAAQARAHKVFERYGIKPLYLIDYPVAAEGWRPLLELYQDGLCEIGAHLHPWVNPPFDEPVTNRNSYPGNLDPVLERAKLATLRDLIGERFGAAPIAYKAGRYGVGAGTAATLEALDFALDASVVPETDFSCDDGPDFSACKVRPYWFGGQRQLLELPMTVAFAGLLRGVGNRLYRPIASPLGLKLKVSNVFAKARLMERIRLTPEGADFAAHMRLTEVLTASGHQAFTFTYHSSSLLPGCSPYVANERELGDFLDRFDRYFDYFLGRLGGRAVSAHELLGLARPTRVAVADAA